MAIYKSKNYENLRKYLQRSVKIESASAVSHLLIEKFVDANKPTGWQNISAHEVKERGIFPSNLHKSFASWREQMVQKGILICMANKNDFNDKEPVHKANLFKYGIQIKKYIEAELQDCIHERIDSKADEKRVDIIENKVDMKVDKAEFNELKRKVENMCNLLLDVLPPDTEERRKIISENSHDKTKCLNLLKEQLMKEESAKENKTDLNVFN